MPRCDQVNEACTENAMVQASLGAGKHAVLPWHARGLSMNIARWSQSTTTFLRAGREEAITTARAVGNMRATLA